MRTVPGRTPAENVTFDGENDTDDPAHVEFTRRSTSERGVSDNVTTKEDTEPSGSESEAGVASARPSASGVGDADAVYEDEGEPEEVVEKVTVADTDDVTDEETEADVLLDVVPVWLSVTLAEEESVGVEEPLTDPVLLLDAESVDETLVLTEVLTDGEMLPETV
jgi:hypothetical protein